MITRALRVLLVHPGASWSTADVFDGLNYGLQQHGIYVVPYRLDTRIEASSKALHALWRVKKRENPSLVKPHVADIMYHAGVGALEMALREGVDVVLIVSAMLQHPDTIVMMKRAGLRVTVLFTETPYDEEEELRIAALVDGCWTTERASLHKFKAVNPRSGYLRHAWHPLKHTRETRAVDAKVLAHDVVFVGSGFAERVQWFNAIDWTGINLGLYGTWKGLGLSRAVKRHLQAENVENEMAAALYRHAKIGLNLYRRSKGWGRDAARIISTQAESVSPRGYELAACGVFHLSEARAEVSELFGGLVPTFSTPAEAEVLIRRYLAADDERTRMAAQLPACVAEHSWAQRARTVIGDLHSLLAQRAA